MSDNNRNRTGETEGRVKALFLLLRILFNDAAETLGLPRAIDESSDSPNSAIFHVGNKGQLVHRYTGKNVAQGDGYTLIWPDSKGINTKRQCATGFLTCSLNDDLTAITLLRAAMIDILARANKGTDNLEEILSSVSKSAGFTQTGRPSKALEKALTPKLAELGPWPVPGLSKTKIERPVQGRRHDVAAYCTGILNTGDDGEPHPCKVEQVRANPSIYRRKFMHATVAEEVADTERTHCWFCKGPLATKADIAAARKNHTVEEEVTI